VFPSLEIGFEKSTIKVQPYNLTQISNYRKEIFRLMRTYCHHLRFGTVSVRKMVNWAANTNAVFFKRIDMAGIFYANLV
jgi:deoxyribodipyrimidine photo-lyase